ncbi:hypothetical protein [Paracoccus sp. N5]|uniref:hypothetical protein n=1 Tax=Paracoccus sp. N5 TaxID=1101189 RepID=UPI000372F40C|nr:hypothetical protein [Paracoccus sp. N5]
MITVADLPAWLPSWQVLLTIALGWHLLTQVVTVILGAVMSYFVVTDLPPQGQMYVIGSASLLIVLAVIITAYLVGGSP